MVTYSTDVVPEARRFDYWRQLIKSNLISVSVERETRNSFFGSLAACEVGSSRLLFVNSTTQHVTRTGSCINQDRKNLYLLNYLVEGRGSTSQHGNFSDIASGDFFLHDSSAFGDLRLVGDFKLLTLSLSRPLIDRHFARAPYLCAMPLSSGQHATVRVAADMFQSMAKHCTQMNSNNLELLVDNFVGIVAMAYGSSSVQCPTASTAHSALLMRIRGYIIAHLGDENLGPSRIAEQHGISERYLSTLFATEDTTVSRWIWAQRLEASRRALSLEEFSERKINEIAFTCGFNDMSHFSFSFKKRYGCTPRQFRAKTAKIEGLAERQ